MTPALRRCPPAVAAKPRKCQHYLHTMVRVTDPPASLAFCCNALGLELRRTCENPAGRFTLTFLSAPGNEAAEIELTHNWNPETCTGGRNFGHIACQVDDICTARERRRARG